MSKEFSEDILIQKNAADLLEKELGWTSVYAFDSEVLGVNGTLGRTSYKEVLLTGRFTKALKSLNPWLTDKQLAEAVERMTEYMSSQTLMQINEQKYQYIRDGVPVTRIKPGGETEEVRAKVIDFASPEKNDFLCVRELWVQGALYKRRADIVGFVNGLPLLFVELKNHDVAVEDAFNKNYRDYLDTIPQLFYHNAMVMFSNGLEARVGTIDSKWEFFHEWKRLNEEDAGNIELPTMLRGICKKENFLDLLENFILYDHSGGSTVKILARNHQYLGVNQAVEKYRNREITQGKLGVFWHTQGSGKSYSMLFLAQKIRRKFEGSPTIVVLTDRDELNKQISETFENCGLLGKSKSKEFMAQSAEDLISKLKGNPSFVFSLIQKFNDTAAKADPIYPDHDIIVMSDEAHRTQNGIFAENLMHLLPTASRIGFTGTPLLKNDNITARTFGGYVSIYDFKRAVEDKATVPLYYENRGERLQELKNPEINEEIAAALEEAGDMDSSQLAKLEQEFAREVHLLTAKKRLRVVAQDFVKHYSDLWTSGKAMMVCYNKVTCVRMYDYVQEYWQQEIKAVEKQLAKCTSQQEYQELKRKLEWMRETEMAVVVSQEQNEMQTFHKWGLDIVPHREKMMKRGLDKEFKDPESRLRIVFVCAMWLTGFDVKTLSCLYIDKPMKAHTLMQTIARANRVAEGKTNGLVVDYIGIVKALKQALADYTANAKGLEGNDPTIDKEKLIKSVDETIAATREFLKEHGIDLQELIDAESFMKLSLLKTAADAMCATVEIRKSYCTLATTLLNRWKYLDRDDITPERKQAKDAIEAIYKELQKKRKHADITDLSVAINNIIDEHLEIDSSVVAESGRRFDISRIDFDLLQREFAKAKQKNLLLKDIQELLQERLAEMLAQNPSRINFYERYQEIIESYNQEQDRASIEKIFEELMDLSKKLSEEERRYVREGFENDEQLSMYDLLMRDDLTKAEIKKIKEVAVELLEKIKSQLATMDHPFEKRETKAAIIITIRDTLWEMLPESYSDESIDSYKDAVFEYVQQRYGGVA